MGLRHLRSEHGSALLIVLVMVVILGLAMGWCGMTWKTIAQREKEEELLWRGDQFRRAIESFVKARQAASKPGQPNGFSPPNPTNQAAAAASYPRSLDDLLKDPGKTGKVRHLRKVYKDPMTGEDFVVIAAPGGGIKGVKSASKLEPFKKDGFSEVYEPFKDAENYQKWEFVYEPGSKVSQSTTAGGTVVGGSQDILSGGNIGGSSGRTGGEPGGGAGGGSGRSSRPSGGRFGADQPPYGDLPDWLKPKEAPKAPAE